MKDNYRFALVNAQENPSIEEQETLAAVCVWKSDKKETIFFLSTKWFII